jgi:drug/metabolite transporter (DMT)-like permease
VSIPPGFAALIAIAGNFVLSLGMSLQKRHIAWIGSSPRKPTASVPPERERRRSGRFYRDFGSWFLGFMLVNAVPAFQYFALTGLTTNVVGAAAGTSVAFTAILAKLLLREDLGKRRLAWTVLLFAAIAAAGFLGEGGSSAAEDLSPSALYIFLGLPLVAGAALFAARRRLKGPRLAATLASFSGCLGGFMVFPLRALQVDAGPGILGWLASPYLYAFLAAGFSSFVLIQAAYKDGEMAAVAPAYYGMQVLWPALASYFVFGAKFLPAQTAAFALVAVCVAMIAGVHPVARKPVVLLTDDREKRVMLPKNKL